MMDKKDVVLLVAGSSVVGLVDGAVVLFVDDMITKALPSPTLAKGGKENARTKEKRRRPMEKWTWDNRYRHV
jgi:hypothetical protein